MQLGGAADQIWAHLGIAPGVVRADLGTGLAVPRPETFQRVSKHIVDKRSFQAPCAQYQISELDGGRATPYLLARNLITAKRTRNNSHFFTIIHFKPTASIHTSSSRPGREREIPDGDTRSPHKVCTLLPGNGPQPALAARNGPPSTPICGTEAAS